MKTLFIALNMYYVAACQQGCRVGRRHKKKILAGYLTLLKQLLSTRKMPLNKNTKHFLKTFSEFVSKRNALTVIDERSSGFDFA